MAGAAASEMILFIGAMVASTLVVGTLFGIGQELSQGMDERAEGLGDQLRGRIALVNDPANVEDDPLTLYVKNTGSIRLELVSFVVLVDGVPSADWDVTVGGQGAEAFGPQQLATIIVNDITPAAGDHVIVVRAGNGASDTLEFTV